MFKQPYNFSKDNLWRRAHLTVETVWIDKSSYTVDKTPRSVPYLLCSARGQVERSLRFQRYLQLYFFFSGYAPHFTRFNQALLTRRASKKEVVIRTALSLKNKIFYEDNMLCSQLINFIDLVNKLLITNKNGRFLSLQKCWKTRNTLYNLFLHYSKLFPLTADINKFLGQSPTIFILKLPHNHPKMNYAL